MRTRCVDVQEKYSNAPGIDVLNETWHEKCIAELSAKDKLPWFVYPLINVSIIYIMISRKKLPSESITIGSNAYDTPQYRDDDPSSKLF